MTNLLVGKVACYDSAMLKVTELFDVCLWRLHDCELDFIYLSAKGGAERAGSTNLKACIHN
jgi:hypothetical protein